MIRDADFGAPSEMIKDALTINLHSGRTCADGRDPTGSGGVSGGDSVSSEIEWILDLMDQHQSQATFFVCNHTARVHEVSIKALAGRGHEIALLNCGQAQRPVAPWKGNFRAVGATKDSLQQIVGRPVAGFRDDSYSLDRNDLAQWSVLADAGFRYDSSVLPYQVGSGKQLSLPRYPFRLALGGDTLFEWPIATVELFGGLFPVACEPYWRLVSYWLLRRSLLAFHWGNWPAVVAIEFDLRWLDPTITATSTAKSARRNDRRLRRLDRLLRDFQFETLESAIGHLRAAELTMLRLKSTPCAQTERLLKRN